MLKVTQQGAAKGAKADVCDGIAQYLKQTIMHFALCLGSLGPELWQCSSAFGVYTPVCCNQNGNCLRGPLNDCATQLQHSNDT